MNGSSARCREGGGSSNTDATKREGVDAHKHKNDRSILRRVKGGTLRLQQTQRKETKTRRKNARSAERKREKKGKGGLAGQGEEAGSQGQGRSPSGKHEPTITSNQKEKHFPCQNGKKSEEHQPAEKSLGHHGSGARRVRGWKKF